MKRFFLLLLVFPWLAMIFLQSCSEKEDPVDESYYVKILFAHHNAESDGGTDNLKLDTLLYENALAQRYMVTDLQYFISGLSFHRCGGDWETVTQDQGIHYVDLRLPATKEWLISMKKEEACYDSVKFIFGLDSANNISNRFPDPPLRDMFWPDVLGGGYHYMKMNLKWKNDTMTGLKPFMFHLGIGQIHDTSGAITGFIQNFFELKKPFAFNVNAEVRDIIIRMEIPLWMTGDNDYDFSIYPTGIMQNQEGMSRALRNGKNAFLIQ